MKAVLSFSTNPRINFEDCPRLNSPIFKCSIGVITFFSSNRLSSLQNNSSNIVTQKDCNCNLYYKLNKSLFFIFNYNYFCNVFTVNLHPQPYEPKQLICILNLPKANLYSRPSSNRAVDLFPKQQKGISTVRQLLAQIVENPLFLGIFALYLLTRDINTTVSTCNSWAIPQNLSSLQNPLILQLFFNHLVFTTYFLIRLF